MNIIIIDGMLGAGKTLAMSILSKYYAEKSGCALFSNYGLYGSYEFNSYRDFLKVVAQKHSIICLDEAHIFLDSRMSHNKGVIYFTQLSYYFRKMRTTVMMTSPQIDSIDKRVRLCANIYVYAEKDDKYFKYHFYDYQSERYLKTKRIKKDDAIRLASKLYDTYYMVEPMVLPRSEEEYREFVELLKKRNLELK